MLTDAPNLETSRPEPIAHDPEPGNLETVGDFLGRLVLPFREQVALSALNGLLASPHLYRGNAPDSPDAPQLYAQAAFAFADAFLAVSKQT